MSKNNPNKNPEYNLNRLPDIEIPSRAPMTGHEPPVAVTRNWIAGDFTGLREVADELYGFAGLSHSEISELAQYVEGLIGDSGSWKSQTADAFRWSFGGDAKLINDLAQVAAAIGRVIEDLGNKLAALEAAVDNMLSPKIESGVFLLTPNYDSNRQLVARNLQGQLVTAPHFGPAAHAGAVARQRFVAALRKAKSIRKEAATQIAVLCDPVNKSLDIYSSPTGDQFDREGRGQGLLRGDQDKADQTAIAALQQQLKSAITSGGDSGITAEDVKQTLSDVTKFGGDASTIGGVVDDIKAMQHASALAQVGKAGDTIEKIASVARDLVVILEMAPK